jgi:hypothetical protein
VLFFVLALSSALSVGGMPAAEGTFDRITYKDSGGFAGGGTGMSLTVSSDGKIEARSRNGASTTRVLTEQEMSDLKAAVAAVDWSTIEQRYMTPRANDLIFKDLTVVIRGAAHETHADSLAKIPPSLQELFRRLDALYRAVSPANPRR